MKKVFLILLVFATTAKQLYSQVHTRNVIDDTLERVVKYNRQDTNEVNALLLLSKKYLVENPPLSIKYANQAKAISDRIEFKEGAAQSLKVIGNSHYYHGDYIEALYYWQQALGAFEEVNNKKGKSNVLGNIGNLFFDKGSYAKALEYNFKSLKLAEEIGDTLRIATACINIGAVYTDKKSNINDAYRYTLKALPLCKYLNDSDAIGTVYVNLGEIFLQKEKFDSAVYFFEKSLIALEFSTNLSYAYVQLGKAYSHKNNYTKALFYQRLAYSVAKKMESKNDIAIALISLAQTYEMKGSSMEALASFQEAESYALKSNTAVKLKEIYEGIFKIYYQFSDYKNAFKYQTLWSEIKDTIYTIETDKRIETLQFNYDIQKKESEIKLLNKDKQMQHEKMEQQGLVLKVFIAGFVLIVVLFIISFRSYRQKQKANLIITQQKEVVEEKNRQITDSITYALRIQSAILPSGKLRKKYLDQSFILYKPKDIVAGDFYWMEISNSDSETILFAACDCTGHGVSGAMVSVMCHNALNRAVKEFGLSQPAAILDKVNELVIENFSKGEDDVKDGMDISLCSYHPQSGNLQWAGANSPLWILRNGEILETKADKQPIGKFDEAHAFTNHEFDLQKGDSIYIFSDGYADQFGGETGKKKLTRKRFRELLLNIQNISFPEQGKELDNFMISYLGSNEQIDDILVMGVRV